jgi:hypothetical protein
MLIASISQSKDKIASWIKMQDPTIYSSQETYLTNKTKYWLTVKGRKRIFLENGP